jgi:hydrogenase expression/formation protein HypC
MCLAIPARVEEIHGEKAIVAIGEARLEVNVVLVAGLAIGQYVLVHAGFAIAGVDEQEALETLSMIREIIADEVC